MLGEIISVFLLLTVVFGLQPLRRVFFPAQTSGKFYLSNGERIVYFDFLKGVAVLAVIIVHITYISIKSFEGSGTFFLFLLNNLTRFAIPFFLIISGILSTIKYEDKINLKHYYWSKFYKLYLPFVFFTIMAIYFHDKDIKDLFIYLANGKVLIPYYFIILILQFYILFPILKYFKDNRVFLYLSFFISLVFFSINNLNYLFGVLLFPKFLFFFVYGMYYRNYFINYKTDKNKAIYWYLIIFVYILIALVVPAYYFNFRPFYGLAIFHLLFIYKDSLILRLGGLYKLICDAGKNSLWIYFVHFSILIGLFYLMGLFSVSLYITFTVVFIISIPTSFIVGKIFSLLFSKILNIFHSRI